MSRFTTSRFTRRELLANAGKTALGLTMGGGALLLGARPAHAVEGSAFRPSVSSSTGGVVACVHPLAGRIGLDVLNAGGNAVDAAVAILFALAVVEPQMSGIGGGGHLLYRRADGETAMLDFNNPAPAAVQRDTFVGPGIHRSPDYLGHRVVAVPGMVAGMAEANRMLGSKALADLIAPAERLAREGFDVDRSLWFFSTVGAARIAPFPATRRSFLLADGSPYPPGSRLVQPDLAWSLRQIMEQGEAAFYAGSIAQRIAADMARAESEWQLNPVLAAMGAANAAQNDANAAQNQLDGGSRPTDRWEQANDVGLMNLQDLAAYRPIWRTALTGNYRGHHVIATPPAAGGVLTLEMLNILEGFDVQWLGQSSADHLHLLAETEKLAIADGIAYLGDPAFVSVPTDRLISKGYANQRRAEISMGQARSYSPGRIRQGDTTHLSVIDRDGNACAITCSVSQLWGSGVVAEGTGILLNDHLANFDHDPIDGSNHNAQGGKRTWVVHSPTIVVKQGQPVLVLGGVGGGTIPLGVVSVIVNTIDFGRDLGHALDDERVEALFHPESPGMLAVEAPKEPDTGWFHADDPIYRPPAPARISNAVLADLAARGHRIFRKGEYYGLPLIHAASADPATGRKIAAADPRWTTGAFAQFP